ncbi:beta-lactamase family protein [Agromyces endophyticus]|uniref:serine hydrolase domain-containing protein n=1 Tax=Agromyces sp. H17E-10 TaxID=2932244 RepID=UPI001FD257A3|nr:serine hydrolase domain-containing protein [Agromyces sp. H17E-10]UOQ91065.1 beta-lactamase family protein [Agromyces sp. H17E-10]
MADRTGGRRRAARAVTAAIVALAAGIALSGCTGGSVDPSSRFEPVDAHYDDALVEKLQATLDQAVALSGSSGGVAGVWAPWAGSWTGASGSVDFKEKSRPVTVDTGFRLATVTSEITCTMLMRLAETGTVSLDDPVDEYVDRVPGLDGITLEQLCRNTSGLGDYYPGLEAQFVQNPERVWSPNELLASGLAVQRTGTPGDDYAYSRTGVLLLSRALEEATGRTWSQLADQYVFEPLGLDDTELPAPDDGGHAGLLGGYASETNGGTADCDSIHDDSSQSSSMGAAAAGAVSSLDDTRRLSEAFATGALLGEHSAREQWTTEPVGGDAPAWYEYGLGGFEYGPLRGTAGESAGALTAAFTDPESGLTVVIALNNSTSGEEFVREAAFALASAGSKAQASGDRKQPLVVLPWSYDQAVEKMTKSAACPRATKGDA